MMKVTVTNSTANIRQKREYKNNSITITQRWSHIIVSSRVGKLFFITFTA